MGTINLDFRHYCPPGRQDAVYEVEAGARLGDKFQWGYVTPEFPDLLIYLISLVNSKQELPLEEPSFFPRFHRSFTGVEILVSRVVLELCDSGLTRDFLEEAVGTITPENILPERRTAEEREKLGLIIRDD